ncbi:DPP IV N-terminal domain-containing protein [Arcticibacter tournemirensis]
MLRSRVFFLSLALVALFQGTIYAQPDKSLRPYYPDHKEVYESYKRAEKLDTVLKKAVFKSYVIPHWQNGRNIFWYQNRLKDNNSEYILVDVAKGIKGKAFDHNKLAEALTKATGKGHNGNLLQINELDFSDDGKSLKIKEGEQWYECDLNTWTCKKIGNPDFVRYEPTRPLQRRRSRWMGMRRDSISPDKQWEAYTKDGNLFAKSSKGQEVIQFTKDGTAAKPYGEFSWSPDSKTLVAYHIDPKEEKEVHFVLSSEPDTTRGVLKSQRYAQPGDEFTSYEMHVFSVKDKKGIKVDSEKIDFFGAPELHWRNGNNRYFTYEKVDRGHQRFRVIEVDTKTGSTRNIIDEKTNTFIYEQRIYTRYLPETHEIVWITEKDGWRHIYLVDELTGKEKKQITRGNWVVRDIDSVDTEKREIWFRASGINPGEDPYFIHYYRIGFDGNNLVSLTPERSNHSLTFSPDRNYYLDTYSQVNIPPVTWLKRTSDGQKIMEVERADVSALLASVVKLPEVFVAKGRDGKTDIWGVICRPSNMDPTRSYPVIENIYAGPQDSFVPKSFLPASEMQSMAELGFIVVQIDGMGTANRSKAFHDVCWHNLADAGLPDRILWMQAMAKKYPQADISRVGVYGTSAGGQNSTGALLFHPEFYKAAVSACGCHDNRVDKQWWNEQWMGFPVGKHYEEQSNVTNAGKLQGDLLLIVGESDMNVPPESTYRVVDALIKSNKDFDLLTIPGMGHSDGGPYGRRKKRDFFVKHLLKAEPPSRNRTEGFPAATAEF